MNRRTRIKALYDYMEQANIEAMEAQEAFEDLLMEGLQLDPECDHFWIPLPVMPASNEVYCRGCFGRSTLVEEEEKRDVAESQCP